MSSVESLGVEASAPSPVKRHEAFVAMPAPAPAKLKFGHMRLCHASQNTAVRHP